MRARVQIPRNPLGGYGSLLVVQALEGGITKVAILVNAWLKFETLLQ